MCPADAEGAFINLLDGASLDIWPHVNNIWLKCRCTTHVWLTAEFAKKIHSEFETACGESMLIREQR
jgi:hypothetical protein